MSKNSGNIIELFASLGELGSRLENPEAAEVDHKLAGLSVVADVINKERRRGLAPDEITFNGTKYRKAAP